MKKYSLILILTLLELWACGSAGPGVPSMSEGLLDMSDTLTLGLPGLEGGGDHFRHPGQGAALRQQRTPHSLPGPILLHVAGIGP